MIEGKSHPCRWVRLWDLRQFAEPLTQNVLKLGGQQVCLRMYSLHSDENQNTTENSVPSLPSDFVGEQAHNKFLGQLS